MTLNDETLNLDQGGEDRAARLHEESLIFIGHDHNILAGDIEMMAAGGVTAKQLHISLDSQVFGPREQFLSSAPRVSLERELRRKERDGAKIPDLAERLHDAAAESSSEGYLRRALVAMDYVHQLVDSSQGRVRIALEPEDIVAAKADGALAVLLGTEGARLIEGRLEVLHMLYRLGLRQLGLIWAFDTEIGAPQSDLSGRGLTDFGRDVVRELNSMGVIVDATHLARRSIEDVLETSSSPITVSHSGAAALNPTLHPEGGWSQLLPDDLLKEVAGAGGVISVHFMSQMVKGGPDVAELSDLLAQFRYLTDLIGPDHVACGPDYLPLNSRLWENQGAEPFSYVRGVETVADFRNVTRMLVAGGMSDEEIGLILGRSLLTLFRCVRQSRAPRHGPGVLAGEGFAARTEGTTPL